MLMDYRTQLFPVTLFALYKFKNRFKNTLIVNEKSFCGKPFDWQMFGHLRNTFLT